MGIGSRLSDVKNTKETSKMKQEFKFDIISPRFNKGDIVLSQDTSSSLYDFLALKSQYDKVFLKWGLEDTHGHQKQNSVNLYGLPGTGKSMAAHVIASEMGKNLIPVSYAELESKYVGETSKNITALFKEAKISDSIIFFDEADAILSRRVTNMSHATDVSVNQTRSVLLTLMDSHDGLIIFTTNFIENYDPAFMRRILSHIKFSLPDKNARRQLFQLYIPKNMPLRADIDMLISLSEGLSGSEISRAVMKAALSAARNNSDYVTEHFFNVAFDEIKTGNIANKGKGTSEISEKKEHIVSQDYVREKIGEQKMKEIMN